MSNRQRKSNTIKEVFIKGGNEMTNRNGSQGSQNQGSPQAQHDQEFSSELISGNNNKGNEYRSKKGSKSKAKPKQSE
jgi:hypothetical protein